MLIRNEFDLMSVKKTELSSTCGWANLVFTASINLFSVSEEIFTPIYNLISALRCVLNERLSRILSTICLLGTET